MELETSVKKSAPKKIKLDFKVSKYATGRRKRSIAKVWVKKGSGLIHVNGKKMHEYFKRPVHQIIVTRPLEISEAATNYDVKCSVKGGGLSGQAGAIIHGIARAIVEFEPELKTNLKIKDNSDKISQINAQLTSLESTVGGLDKIRQDFIKESAKKSAKAKN